MYPPKHYQIQDKNEHIKLIELIQNKPLATLVINIAGEPPHISHIPFHFNEQQSELIGHTSNQHPLAKQLKLNQMQDISLIFHGEEGYISPNYSQGQPVPTWNYAKVLVRGEAKAVTDNDEKYKQMDKTTQYFERDQEKPWVLDSTPNKAIIQMLNAITIFKITITEISGQFKLSQNKSTSIKQEISEALHLKGNKTLAKQMLS